MKNKRIEKIKKKIVPILKKNKVVRAGIFGSYARREEKKNSEKVDLLSYKSVHSLLKDRILKEEIRII